MSGPQWPLATYCVPGKRKPVLGKLGRASGYRLVATRAYAAKLKKKGGLVVGASTAFKTAAFVAVAGDDCVNT